MKTKATLKMMVDPAMTALFLGRMGYHMMDNRMHVLCETVLHLSFSYV